MMSYNQMACYWSGCHRSWYLFVKVLRWWRLEGSLADTSKLCVDQMSSFLHDSRQNHAEGAPLRVTQQFSRLHWGGKICSGQLNRENDLLPKVSRVEQSHAGTIFNTLAKGMLVSVLFQSLFWTTAGSLLPGKATARYLLSKLHTDTVGDRLQNIVEHLTARSPRRR